MNELRWEYAIDTKQVWAPTNDSDDGEGIAENYGDDAQGYLLAASKKLLAACQKARDAYKNNARTVNIVCALEAAMPSIEAAIAAALPRSAEPAKGNGSGYREDEQDARG